MWQWRTGAEVSTIKGSKNDSQAHHASVDESAAGVEIVCGRFASFDRFLAIRIRIPREVFGVPLLVSLRMPRQKELTSSPCASVLEGLYVHRLVVSSVRYSCTMSLTHLKPTRFASNADIIASIMRACHFQSPVLSACSSLA